MQWRCYFIETVGAGDKLKDSVGVYFILLFLYRFGFCSVSNTLFCVFILRVIRNYLRMLVLILILKIVLLKMVLMVINCWKILIWCVFNYINLCWFYFLFLAFPFIFCILLVNFWFWRMDMRFLVMSCNIIDSVHNI